MSVGIRSFTIYSYGGIGSFHVSMIALAPTFLSPFPFTYIHSPACLSPSPRSWSLLTTIVYSFLPFVCLFRWPARYRWCISTYLSTTYYVLFLFSLQERLLHMYEQYTKY
ncbi:hypothetical protein B0H12DRAFT_1110945 [Mycena haematopus]|nr:hypothetical protein B0H12DRAFT_1110945 [Mycena haematopus]